MGGEKQRLELFRLEEGTAQSYFSSHIPILNHTIGDKEMHEDLVHHLQITVRCHTVSLRTLYGVTKTDCTERLEISESIHNKTKLGENLSQYWILLLW